ncbi:MAG: hypothetical protein ACR2JK_11960 [Geodermatophilaceae bacterium]
MGEEEVRPRLPHVPEALGFDERVREVLSVLAPGTTHDRRIDLLEFVSSARELLRSG